MDDPIKTTMTRLPKDPGGAERQERRLKEAELRREREQHEREQREAARHQCTKEDGERS